MGPILDLTVKERIQLHLYDYRNLSDSYVVPLEMTQEGIARGTGIDIRHVVQYVRPLMEKGLVRERKAHISGGPRRRKVYDLTESGSLLAYGVLDAVRSEVVKVKDAEGVRDASISDVLIETKGTRSVLEVIREFRLNGLVDLQRTPAAKARGFVEMLSSAPLVQRFVGREEVLQVLGQDQKSKIFLVQGIAGIGKTTLAAMVCQKFSGLRNIYWHKVRSWDTLHSSLAYLAKFLSALGMPRLQSITKEGRTDLGLDVLREDLSRVPSLIVFDDAHEGGPEVVSLLRFLKDTLKDTANTSVLVLSREKIEFYDRRDVISGMVSELNLQGLKEAEVEEFLEGYGHGHLAPLARRFGGHPLLLSLLQSPEKPTELEEAIHDVNLFFQETVYNPLSSREKRIMKIASFYEVPVPREALLIDPDLTQDDILGLVTKSLVISTGGEAYELHDTLREFFDLLLTTPERDELGTFASDKLGSLAAIAARERKFSTSVDFVENGIRVSTSANERRRMHELMGEIRERLGDMPGSLKAFREALNLVTESEDRARIHRKVGSALEGRGQLEAASDSVELGFSALGIDSSLERGWLSLTKSRVVKHQEEWEEARDLAAASLQIFEVFGNVSGQGEALRVLGNIETNSPTGRQSAAEKYLTEALSLGETINDVEFTAAIHTELAYLYAYRVGAIEESLKHIGAVEAHSEALGDPIIRRTLLLLKGWFYLKVTADLVEAQAQFEEARILGKDIYSPITVAFANYGLTTVTYHLGDFEPARDGFYQVSDTLITGGFPSVAVESLCMAAECCLLVGDLQGFKKTILSLNNPKFSRGVESRGVMTRVFRSILTFIEGERLEAISSLERSSKSASIGSRAAGALPEFFMAVLLGSVGQEELAEEHKELAVNILAAHSRKAALAILPERYLRLRETLGLTFVN